ncbi:MAG: EAL domain-containing protein [Nitrospirae bacterium]|nr:EAL domain-containing protein [Nitrospirota bacterium]
MNAAPAKTENIETINLDPYFINFKELLKPKDFFMPQKSETTIIDLVMDPKQSTVEIIAIHVPTIQPQMPCLNVLSIFHDQSEINVIAVTENNIPLGLVNRRQMLEIFSTPYSRELHHKHSIVDFVQRNTFIVEKGINLHDLSQIIIQSPDYLKKEYFIITSNNQYYAVGRFVDLLEQLTLAKQAQLFILAHYDQLTGLANRLLFHDRLQQAISSAERSNDKVALLYIDLDGFKFINDTYGHNVGDMVLIETAHRLRACVRQADTVSRLGGDEFAIILTLSSDNKNVLRILNNILLSIREPIKYHQHDLHVGASIGISLFPDDSVLIDDLIKKADIAMYYVKENGKNAFKYFSNEFNEKIMERSFIEIQLRKVLLNNQLYLVYQPILDSKTRKIVSIETLLRWYHPEKGNIAPDYFIPIAEEIGMIIDIGKWVFKNACLQYKRLYDLGVCDINISVNLSMKQISSTTAVKGLIEILRQLDIPADRFTLELTETQLIKNYKKIIENMQILKKEGFSFSIDDFGTGYSSLSYLLKLSVDEVKIDKIFIENLPELSENRKLVSGIIAMSHALRLCVVAEGVESQAQVDYLLNKGCNKLQGYFLYRPVSSDVICELLLMQENDRLIA